MLPPTVGRHWRPAGLDVPGGPGSGGAVPVEVLADEERVVAGPLQPRRQGVVGVEGLEAAALALDRVRLVVVGVLAGQQGRARRDADRGGRDPVGERDAPVRDQLAGVRHELQVAGCGVVGGDQQHVRPAGPSRGQPGGLDVGLRTLRGLDRGGREDARGAHRTAADGRGERQRGQACGRGDAATATEIHAGPLSVVSGTPVAPARES